MGEAPPSDGPLVMHKADEVPSALVLFQYQTQASPVHPAPLRIHPLEMILYEDGVGVKFSDIVDGIAAPNGCVAANLLRAGKVSIVDECYKVTDEI